MRLTSQSDDAWQAAKRFLSAEPQTTAQLAAKCGIPFARVSLALVVAAEHGLVAESFERLPSGYRRSRWARKVAL